jgi:hypothetical protein
MSSFAIKNTRIFNADLDTLMHIIIILSNEVVNMMEKSMEKSM